VETAGWTDGIELSRANVWLVNVGQKSPKTCCHTDKISFILTFTHPASMMHLATHWCYHCLSDPHIFPAEYHLPRLTVSEFLSTAKAGQQSTNR